jgi:hypothetical protein
LGLIGAAGNGSRACFIARKPFPDQTTQATFEKAARNARRNVYGYADFLILMKNKN